ncbi:MAG TPA: hypothetical protein VJJ83_03460, partial [Candidatus Babeliales bacterium]|nr:hypothetical protein [Candidatus Babeliales bacterium]
FTLNTPPSQMEQRVAELAALQAQRQLDLAASLGLSGEALERYLTGALAIAQLIQDAVIKPQEEQRLMAAEDRLA